MLKEYLKDNILITDGAMGTYYGKKMGSTSSLSEPANLTNPQLVKAIHREYIRAGAKLIRTNTFSANAVTLSLSQAELTSVIQAGYHLAQEAAQETAHDQIYLAASIGPIPEPSMEHDQDLLASFDQYKHIVDTFLDLGAKNFFFETLSDLEDLRPVFRYIKDQDPTAFILTQFAMVLEGSTRKGLTISELNHQIRATDTIDAFGFNCGVGPTHLVQLIKEITPITQIVSALPNAGYPQIVNERTVYHENPEYFAHVMLELATYGVKILGGCCGTTPAYIEALAKCLQVHVPQKLRVKQSKQKQQPRRKKAKINPFRDKLANKQFTITVELDPPLTGNAAPTIRAAKRLQQAGVDAITIADSPLARARMDSLVLAAKIQREIGITTIPHLCCRDRNIIAAKASLLAAHMEGIRNILAVTGDPIASNDRSEIKSVFNLNSMTLMKLIGQLNQGNFPQDSFFLGGALNLNVVNPGSQITRMEQKMQNGASFFLTQPIFDDTAVSTITKIKQISDIPILAGIMPLVSLNNALFIHNEVPGIRIPDMYLTRFKPDMDRDTANQVGIDIAYNIASKLRSVVDGFYFITPFNRVDIITTLIYKLQSAVKD